MFLLSTLPETAKHRMSGQTVCQTLGDRMGVYRNQVYQIRVFQIRVYQILVRQTDFGYFDMS